MEDVHYVIVRRDMPVGVVAAMIVHAAGESATNVPGFKGCTAVVLAVDNEAQLSSVLTKLRQEFILHIAVWENSPPYAGQLMAIGVVPGPREELGPVFQNYSLYWVDIEPPAVRQ